MATREIDTVEWTQGIPETNINCVLYADGLWVAGGSTPVKGIYWSEDGKNWTHVTGDTAQYKYGSVCFADGLWVIVGDASAGIWWSEDGKNWTQTAITDNLRAVAYANGLWVAGGDSGHMYWSEDGKNWTSGIGATSDTIYGFIHANGLWLANTRSSGAWWSEDGKNWTKIAGLSGGAFFKQIAYTNGLWVGGNYGFGTGLWWSEDGKNWTLVSSLSSYQFSCVYYAQGKWFAGSFDGAGLWNSTDGKNWSQVPGYTASYSVDAISFADGLWIMSTQGHVSPRLHWSLDGIEWHPCNSAPTNTSSSVLYYAEGLWQACNGAKLWYGIVKYLLPVIDRFNVDGQTYEMEPVLDPVPTQDSVIGVESGGVWSALKQIKDSISKSDVPVSGSSALFTAGGAWADKATGAVAGSTKVFTEKELYKYLRWLLNTFGYTSTQIPTSL